MVDMLKRPDTTDFLGTSATVLVVDDAVGARYLVTKTLDQLGFSTLIAWDGETTLGKVYDFHPDAIVTDLEMPGMDGEQLMDALRSNENPCIRELPIVVCSSKCDAATMAHLAALGASAIVPKPVDVGLLASAALRHFRLA